MDQKTTDSRCPRGFRTCLGVSRTEHFWPASIGWAFVALYWPSDGSLSDAQSSTDTDGNSIAFDRFGYRTANQKGVESSSSDTIARSFFDRTWGDCSHVLMACTLIDDRNGHWVARHDCDRRHLDASCGFGLPSQYHAEFFGRTGLVWSESSNPMDEPIDPVVNRHIGYSDKRFCLGRIQPCLCSSFDAFYGSA